MDKYNRLGKNTILVFIGNIGSKSISFLMLPFYTKWLSVEEFGITDIITIYSAFLIGLVSACLADSIFIFPKDKEFKVQKRYFTTGLIFAFISFLLASLLFSVVKYVFIYYETENSFTEYTWYVFWIMVATFLQNYMQQFSRSINKVRVYAISGILLTGSLAVFAFLLIPDYGVSGFIIAQVASFFFSALYTFFHSKSFKYFSLKAINIDFGKQMLKYSFPLIPNSMMWLLVSSINRPILEHYLGLKSVGIYAVANKFPSILIVIFSVFIYSWQISVLEEFDKPNYKNFYNKVFRLIFFILIVLSCLVTIFSKMLISIMADQKFIDAWYILPLLAFSVLFSSLSAFVGTNFSATKESKYYFYSSFFGALTSVLFNFLLIPFWGLYGAAVAVILSFAVTAIFRIKYTWNLVRIQNLRLYIVMFVVNLLIILITIYIDSKVYKNTLYVFLLGLMFLINKETFLDLKKLGVMLKKKVL